VKRLEAQDLVTRSRRDDDERVLDVRLTQAGTRLRTQALEVPGKVMASVGTDAAALLALRDALQPFAGAR
jgi:DNA-binding MarR family transcriptional regulator